jgi:hypothetical protein
VPRKTFVAGEILTAADVNTNLMDQAVMTFADDAARTTALPSPSEGMVTYLADSDALNVWTGSAWIPAASGATLGSGTVLQVVSTTKTDTFSASLAGGGISGEVTGLTATITPRLSTSLVLVLFTIQVSSGNGKGVDLILLRGGTAIDAARGDADGNRVRVSSGSNNQAPNIQTTSAVFLDSPDSASAVTYSFNLHNGDNGGQTVYVNRSVTDSNTTQFARAASTITLLEVAG